MYYHPVKERQIAFFTNNMQTSLYRLKQKTMFNLVENQFKYQNLFFVTLTVDEVHYDEVFNQQAGAHFFRKFLTNFRNTFKRRFGMKVGYVWRIERGQRNTKRLHFHCIFNTFYPTFWIREYMLQKWEYCDWDALDIEKSFQKLDSINLAAIYASKYISKLHDIDNASTACEVKTDLKTRIYSSSRDWKIVPYPVQMKFNFDVKVWEPKIKENCKVFHTEDCKNILHQFRKMMFNSIYKFSHRFKVVKKFFNLWLQKNIYGYRNVTYFSMYKLKRLQIQSIKQVLSESDLNHRLRQNTEINKDEIQLDHDNCIQQLQFIQKYFSYEKKLNLKQNIKPFHEKQLIHIDYFIQTFKLQMQTMFHYGLYQYLKKKQIFKKGYEYIYN